MMHYHEGFQKAGTHIDIDVLASVFHAGRLNFATSRAVPLLQLADFTAFTLNRMQLAIRRDHRDWFDLQLLEILSPVAPLFLNMTKKVVSPSPDGPLLPP